MFVRCVAMMILLSMAEMKWDRGGLRDSREAGGLSVGLGVIPLP